MNVDIPVANGATGSSTPTQQSHTPHNTQPNSNHGQGHPSHFSQNSLATESGVAGGTGVPLHYYPAQVPPASSSNPPNPNPTPVQYPAMFNYAPPQPYPFPYAMYPNPAAMAYYALPPQHAQSRTQSAASSVNHSDSEMSEASTDGNSSATSTASTARQKRRRTDPEDTQPAGPSRGPTNKGKEPERTAPSPHAIPSKDIEVLASQMSQMQKTLLELTQNVLTQPKEVPLIGSNELGEQLLQGMKETVEILRTGFASGIPLNQGAGGDREGKDEPDDVDVAMRDADADLEGFRVVGEVKRGPVSRGQSSNRLARLVRNFFKDIYRGQVVNGSTWQPANGPCCTVEDFRLDLTKPPGDKWNHSAKKVFTLAFLNRDDPELESLKPSKDDVGRLFISNFRATRSKMMWAQLQPADQEEERQARRRQERKRWLYFRRVRAAERSKKTTRHLRLLSALGIDGMSTDVSDHNTGTGRPIFRIMNKLWRHPNATGCLRTLDGLHRDSRFRPLRRNTQGAHPHDRTLSSLPSTSPPVPGLPSGLYNPKWLELQNEAVREYLEVVESGPYDFSHPAEIDDLVSRNNGKLDSIHGFA